eukprot:4632643-Prymnesium_polylepis.1
MLRPSHWTVLVRASFSHMSHGAHQARHATRCTPRSGARATSASVGARCLQSRELRRTKTTQQHVVPAPA